MAIKVTVAYPSVWTSYAAELAELLSSADANPESVTIDQQIAKLKELLRRPGESRGAKEIADRIRAPSDPDCLFTIADPAYWSTRADELADVLMQEEWRHARHFGPTDPARRLTMSVDEAAAALGISRAFAYEAVRRNEIPHIKIGKRILIPKVALQRMLDAAQPSDDTTEQ